MSSWFKTSTKDLSKSIAQLLEGSVGHPIGLSSPDSVTSFYKSFYIPYSYISVIISTCSFKSPYYGKDKRKSLPNNITVMGVTTL